MVDYWKNDQLSHLSGPPNTSNDMNKANKIWFRAKSCDYQFEEINHKFVDGNRLQQGPNDLWGNIYLFYESLRFKRYVVSKSTVKKEEDIIIIEDA